MAKTVAYLRVSTADQNTEKNKKEILLFTNDREFGNVDFFEETVSGKKSWKEREIKKIIDELDEGDRLIVPELSRLGRSMLEIMEILAIAREKGIHIYDNTDPQDPVHLLFINVPGNLDIAVNSDYLYVDSYVDLVALDISNIDTDINSVVETHRIEDVFPYDAYQNIPDGIYLGRVDQSLGVVVEFK